MRTTLAPRGPAPRWAGIIANGLAVVFTVACVSLAIALLATPRARAADDANNADDANDASPNGSRIQNGSAYAVRIRLPM